MASYDETLKKAKEIYEILDLIDLSNDITEGLNLIKKRNSTPVHIYNLYGYVEINANYKQIENDIVNYINKIIEKYKIYIDLYNLGIQIKQQFFQDNNSTYNKVRSDLEAYVNFLITLQNAKIAEKTIEEIFE